MIRTALLLVWLSVGLRALEPLHAPQLLPVADRAEDHWRALFALDPGWIARHIAALEAAEPRRWPVLLGARLLYDGQAWNRRPSRSRSLVGRRLPPPPHAAVRQHILRRLRWSPARPALLPVYLRALERPWPGDQVLGLLDLAAAIDRAAAVARARVLADPGRTGDRPGVRYVVQAWLIERGAIAHPDDPLPGVIFAQGEADERLQLLRRLDDAALAPHVRPVATDILTGLRFDRLEPMQRRLVHACCRRLGCDDVGALLPLLQPILAQGRRAEATALLDRLAELPGDCLNDERRQLLLTTAGRRVGTTDDLALRHALLGFLLAWEPAAAVRRAGFGDPWAALGRHRAGGR